MKKTISVRYAMTRNPVIVAPNDSVESVAKKMIKDGVGSLLVEENGRLRGIVTEKDLIGKIVAKNLNPAKITVSKIMSNIIVTIDPERDILEAIKIMNERKVRRLPVIDATGKLLGLITIHDILKLQPDLFEIIAEKNKINPHEFLSNEGHCPICGNFTVLHRKKNKLVCDECD
jgi:CBS domain-containing protein/ribosomal protein S27AE